jgi:HCO3- transporter family
MVKRQDEVKDSVRPVDNEDLMPDAGKIVLEPGKYWGKVVVEEMRNTVLATWWQEVTNFNQKTVSASLLMFITVLAPTLTFGAVYGKVTGNRFGPIENIISTSWVGIVYPLTSGMPLVRVI